MGWPGPMTYRQYCVWREYLVEVGKLKIKDPAYGLSQAKWDEVMAKVMRNRMMAVTRTADDGC